MESLADELSQKRLAAANEMLEREIEQQKLLMNAHDGHYKHMVGYEPMTAAVVKPMSHSEKQLSIPIQGEGDVCTNVTKFMNNDKWYKQTNEGRQEMTKHHEKLQKKLAGKSDTTVADLEREMHTTKKSFADKLEAKSREVAQMVNEMNDARSERNMLDRKAIARKSSPFSESLEKQYAAKDALMSKLRLDIWNAQKGQDELLEMSVRREKALRQKLQQAKINERSSLVTSSPTVAPAKIESDALTSAIDEVCKQNRLYESHDTHTADTVVPKVEASLNEHDQKLGSQALKFKDDLENELKEQVAAHSTANQTPSRVEEPAVVTVKPVFDIKWAEPAIYKVLAYDSGNDIIKNEDMPSNATQHEQPISISHALSQLYQPARFVSHVASLQSESYQVVSASRDLLVFRKVAPKPTPAEPAEKAAEATSKTSALPVENASKPSKTSTAQVNPIDGTSSRDWIPPPTGNYASPTGFVNYDPVFPLTPAADAPEPTTTTNAKQTRKDHIVRREETVFSGTKRERRSLARLLELEHRERQRRRGTWRHRVRFALSVGATSAALMYALGVGAELARGEKVGGEVRRREA